MTGVQTCALPIWQVLALIPRSAAPLLRGLRGSGNTDYSKADSSLLRGTGGRPDAEETHPGAVDAQEAAPRIPGVFGFQATGWLTAMVTAPHLKYCAGLNSRPRSGDKEAGARPRGILTLHGTAPNGDGPGNAPTVAAIHP